MENKEALLYEAIKALLDVPCRIPVDIQTIAAKTGLRLQEAQEGVDNLVLKGFLLLRGDRVSHVYTEEMAREHVEESLEWEQLAYCIEGDNAKFHVSCAKERYGSVAIRMLLWYDDRYYHDVAYFKRKFEDTVNYCMWPQDKTGNLLQIVKIEEIKSESLTNVCAHCLQSFSVRH